MSHVEQVKTEIRKEELKLESYRGKLAELTAKDEQTEKIIRPLQKKIAEGDISLLQKVAKLRGESAEVKLHVEALQVEIPELKGLIEALRTTRMEQAENSDRTGRQRARYNEMVQKASVLQKNATEFRQGCDDFQRILSEMTRDNDRAVTEKMKVNEDFPDKFFKRWLEATLYPHVKGALSESPKGHEAREQFSNLPEVLDDHIGQFFTARPRKAA